jgi:Zn-dependent peptidase ImmA (M78 family)
MKNIQSYLRKIAWKFIIEQKISYLPVDPFELAFQLGFYVLTYEQYAAIVNKSVQEIIDQYDNDGFCFWSMYEACFIICYNSALPMPVCRWTLMHEIAHLYLGHLSPNFPVLSRVRTEQRSLFEVEAQGFARRVLCPSIVLHNCLAFEPEEIMQLCGIGYEAASYRSKYMKRLESRQHFRLSPMEILVEKQFERFIQYYLQAKQL